MARGAVIVILSDGWERGEPGAGRARDGAAGAARVPDRVGQPARRRPRGFVPRAGGMAAALPHVDALVCGHSARGARRGRRRDRAPSATAAELERCAGAEDEEPWASATPVPAARSRCRAATARAEERRRPGWTCSRSKALHLPGLRAPRRAAAPGRRPAAGVLRPRGPQRADRPPGAQASSRRRAVADEAYRAVFLRVHPTGQDGAEPDDRGRRQRGRATRSSSPTSSGCRRSTSRSCPPTRTASAPATGSTRARPTARRRRSPARPRRSAPRRSCSRARRWRPAPTSCGGTTARSSARGRRAHDRRHRALRPRLRRAAARRRGRARRADRLPDDVGSIGTSRSAPSNGDADRPHRQGAAPRPRRATTS